MMNIAKVLIFFRRSDLLTLSTTTYTSIRPWLCFSILQYLAIPKYITYGYAKACHRLKEICLVGLKSKALTKTVPLYPYIQII